MSSNRSHCFGDDSFQWSFPLIDLLQAQRSVA